MAFPSMAEDAAEAGSDGLDPRDPATRPIVEEVLAEWAEIWENEKTPEAAVGYADTLTIAGFQKRIFGEPEAAEAQLRLAGSLFEQYAPSRLHEPQHHLALALQDLGELVESEELMRSALETRREEMDRSDPDQLMMLVNSLDQLALLLLIKGDYPEVPGLLQEALSLLPDGASGDQARITGHLGRYHHTLGSHARALALFDQALALEPTDPEALLSLRSQRALCLFRLGRIDEAELETEEVAQGAQELLRDRPLQAVPYLNNLGAMSLSLGRVDEAIAAFGEAKGMILYALSPDHPALAGIEQNLGSAYQRAGQLEAAREAFRRASELHDLYLPETHLRVAETRRSLAVNALLRNDPEAAAMVAESTKAGLRLLEELIADGSEIARLNFLERFDLVSLPCALGDAETIADVLIASKARLLEVLVGGDPGTATRDWEEVAESLPPGSAFVDFCRFRPVDEEESPRYGAIVLPAGGSPEWVLLGTDPELERWIGELRERLDWLSAQISGQTVPAPALTARNILRSLHQGFWEPIEDTLPESTRNLVISPDGTSHFLPFAVLIDPDKKLLCHKYDQVTRVGSGRDLLNHETLPDLDASPWAVLTVSNFPQASSNRHQTPLSRLLASLAPMPGTEEEAELLEKLAPSGSVFLSDGEVTEQAISQLHPAPSVLHFGGHAFFLDSAEHQSSGAPIDFDQERAQLSASGLVLYNGVANAPEAPIPRPDDDLLFPAELANLPLQDTRLVTLSSCDSGSGTPVDGEGILGLQRGLSVAGAQEIAVALWPISDRSTPRFMERFYRLATASNRPGQALWQTQAEMIPSENDPGFEEAVLRYAPFVLSQSHSLKVGPRIIAEEPKRVWPWIVACLLAAGITTIFLFFRARRQANSITENQSLTDFRRKD